MVSIETQPPSSVSNDVFNVPIYQPQYFNNQNDIISRLNLKYSSNALSSFTFYRGLIAMTWIKVINMRVLTIPT